MDGMRRSPFLVGLTGAAGALLTYAGFLAVRHVATVLMLVVLAGFLAIGLNRVVLALTRRGLRRRLAVPAVLVGVLVLGVVAVLAFVPLLVEQTAELVGAIPDLLDELRDSPAVRELNESYHLDAQLRSLLTASNLEVLVSGVLGGLVTLAGGLFAAVTVTALMCYFLVAFERILAAGYRLVPASRRDGTRHIGDQILAKIGGYLVGAVLVATVAGTTSWLFMRLTGIPYAFVLALVVAILDLIPQIGATLGAVVVILVALTVSLPVAVGALVFFLVYQQVENWFIYPRVMRQTVHVSNLAAILAVLVGAALAGVLGVFLAVPVCAAVQLVVRQLVLPRQDAR